MNEQIQQARNELLQNISHDIRTPLTIVQGGIQAMIHGVEIEPGGNNNMLKSMYDEVLQINTFIVQLAGFQSECSLSVEPQAVVKMHAHQIKRVLANLVNNACKFSPVRFRVNAVEPIQAAPASSQYPHLYQVSQT